MENKSYTVEDFKVNTYAYGRDTITDNGRWSTTWNRYDVNYSDILTRLIQEAGRYSERYASDLFIDWECLMEKMKDRDFSGGVYLYGFRRDGVDHRNFVLSRYSNNGKIYAEKEYRSMWRLDIKCEDDEIEMTLGRVF